LVRQRQSCAFVRVRVAVGGAVYHAAMPNHLSLEQHLEALGRSGAALAEAMG
jgi:hypothetical protein